MLHDAGTPMPNKHAAIKALRKNKKAAAKNTRMKAHARALLKQFNALMQEGKKAEARSLTSKIQQILDKAAKTDIYHRNKTRRKVSTTFKTLAKE